jgi:hypothetical protein
MFKKFLQIWPLDKWVCTIIRMSQKNNITKEYIKRYVFVYALIFCMALSAYSSAQAYTITIHNKTDRKVKVSMDPTVLDRRTKTVKPGKEVDRNVGGMCIKRFVAEDIDKKKMFKAQKNIDRTQQMKGRKSHYYVTGSRCKSHDVYIYDKDGVFFIDKGETRFSNLADNLTDNFTFNV